jgi:uridine monophosphate synthetase
LAILSTLSCFLITIIIMTTALAKAAGATETVIATAAPADPPNTAANRTSFRSKLEARVAAADSLLCVGLDPHFGELFPSPAPVTNAAISGGRDPTAEAATFLPPPPPTEEELADAAYTFCKTLIDATSQYAACYKPNAAFFEAIGPKCGAETLRRVIHAIPPDIPVLLDSKRGDIGTTASAYAKAAYEGLGADAVTLSPLMGLDSVLPFVSGTCDRSGGACL